ncbi:hypothetical protein [[Clostridium] symbiosum]|uniref:hypothetical protein n=1 Tax=Clostridium symbiosum TaxID=1512 RepID=UPI00214CA660|nr:hypothetical protein [[Clostridium] symbiosum]MCR1941227.1 hypothetical protein [[Clostridium] symbiosum]
MYDLSQNGYTDRQIKKLLKENRQISFECDLLNSQEKYVKTLHSIKGNVSFDAGAEIMGTASFSMAEEEVQGINLVDARLAAYMLLLSPAGWIRFPLGVYIMTSPQISSSGGHTTYNVDCYDKSVILKEDKLTDRLYIPQGAKYDQEVRSILATAGVTKVSIEGSNLTVPNALEFEIGTDKLTVVNDLLYAINYNPLHFDRTGTAVSERYIVPSGRRAEDEYLTDELSIIRPGASRKQDLYNVPNVIIRYVENPDAAPLRSEYINDSVDSILSTVRRGRKIVDIEAVDDIADQKTLDDYTRRVAVEKSQINDSMSLTTALMPHHGYKDCYFVRHDKMGMAEKYIESSWSMEFAVGGSMTHNIKRITLI